MTETGEKADARPMPHADVTRRAIVLAAIRVIAENGVAGASLRAINVAAGSRNSSAAHYHFGTKFAVIEAAVALMRAEIAPPQEARLSALEAQAAAGPAPSPREILEALYQPYLEWVENPEYGQAAAKFCSRLLVESDAEIQELVNSVVGPSMLRALALMAQALPHLPMETLALRMFITGTNIVHGCGDLPALRMSPFGDLAGGSNAGFYEHLFDYLSGALSAVPAPSTP